MRARHHRRKSEQTIRYRQTTLCGEQASHTRIPIIPQGEPKERKNLPMNMKKAEVYRNEIKSYIVRAGMTMTEVVEYLSDEYGWSASVPNLSGKLRRGSLRYGEAVELADALGYDIIWKKRER